MLLVELEDGQWFLSQKFGSLRELVNHRAEIRFVKENELPEAQEIRQTVVPWASQEPDVQSLRNAREKECVPSETPSKKSQGQKRKKSSGKKQSAGMRLDAATREKLDKLPPEAREAALKALKQI